jgi:hypothetical protein
MNGQALRQKAMSTPSFGLIKTQSGCNQPHEECHIEKCKPEPGASAPDKPEADNALRNRNQWTGRYRAPTMSRANSSEEQDCVRLCEKIRFDLARN